MSQWQPIKTAPQDGSPILGYDGQSMTTVYYIRSKGLKGWWNLVESGAYAEDGEWTPTYWMPLPNPPYQEENHMNINEFREAIEAAREAMVAAYELLKKDWTAMEQDITKLEDELAETIRSHQRQNATCQAWEEENDRLEERIKVLEEQLVKANR